MAENSIPNHHHGDSPGLQSSSAWWQHGSIIFSMMIRGLFQDKGQLSRYRDSHYKVNILRPRQNGCRFADDTFKRIFWNENVRTSIKISLKFVPKGPINNNPALVQIMAWCRSGDKPLSEPMMVSLLTHICVTRPQWVMTIVRRGFFIMKFIYY